MTTPQIMEGIQLSVMAGFLIIGLVIVWIKFLIDAPALSRTSIHPSLDSDWKSRLESAVVSTVCGLIVAGGCIAVAVKDLHG